MFYKTTNGKFGTYDTYYYDPDANIWAWKMENTYYMSANVGQGIRLGYSAAYYPSGYIYSGFDYYVCGSLYLWREGAYYYITYYLGFGTLATNAWWMKSATGGISGTYTKQGTAGSDISVMLAPIAGWACSSQFGLYTPVSGGGMTGNRYLGTRTYQYSGGGFVETASTYGGKPAFTDGERWLWRQSNKWTISGEVGMANPAIGYWEKVGAAIEGEYVRVYEGGGSPPQPAAYTLSAPSYSEGCSRSSIYMAQVALWL